MCRHELYWRLIDIDAVVKLLYEVDWGGPDRVRGASGSRGPEGDRAAPCIRSTARLEPTVAMRYYDELLSRWGWKCVEMSRRPIRQSTVFTLTPPCGPRHAVTWEVGDAAMESAIDPCAHVTHMILRGRRCYCVQRDVP